MPLETTATHIFCQKCGASWLRSDTRAMGRFAPQPSPPELASPASIAAAGLLMTACPKDAIPVLDKLMLEGPSRLTEGDETDPRRPPPSQQTGGTKVTTFPA